MTGRSRLVIKFIGLLVFGCFSCCLFNNSAFALDTQVALSESQLDMFAENNIVFYDPTEGSGGGECERRIPLSGLCFKVSSSIDASEAWYAEGCLNTGDCVEDRVKYYAHGKPPKQDNGLRITRKNTWIYDDTRVDDEMGGLQYIYAENYDYDYESDWQAKMTPNGGSSTQKYYWIVLPDQAYTTGFGELYVATFENSSEPIYFITFDAHACPHQSEDYCGQAAANPDGTEIGKEFFGVLSKNGSPSAAIGILGKLTSFCRLQGRGEVTVNGVENASIVAGGGGSGGSGGSGGGSSASYAGEYPQYFQSDYANSDHVNSSEDWTIIPYGSGTVSSSGCGAVSMAMLTTVATGQDVYPQDIIEITKSRGQYPSTSAPAELNAMVGERYGFEVIAETYSSKSDAYEKIKRYLNDGYMVQFSGEGCHEGFATPYRSGGCTSGHFVGIFSIDENDRIKVANSAFGGNSETDLQNLIDAIHLGRFTAIEGGSGPRNNDCDGDNDEPHDNLTEEEAQKIADYYNSDAVSASEWSLPHGKTNCVSFSRWFAQALTSMGKTSLSGNGRDMAHNIATAGGFSEGNDPKPYAVFSVTKGRTMCGASLCGHTGVIVAVDTENDDVITIEAAYPSTPAQVKHRNISYFENDVYDNLYTYLDSALDNDKINEIIGS